MAGTISLEAVKRKIKYLQGQADNAEEKAERLQKELLVERKTKGQVSIFKACSHIGAANQTLNYPSSSRSIFLYFTQ